ncbi:MAG: glycosyltransferase family 2 protein, partial [Pyrinomonadaceae bacterium]|nr:glycosyltransferase family 2 protein [Pyrinomonadaceae bacterium]
MNPLLSICIPTYNRAQLLKEFLAVLETEVAPFGDAVEVVVSDNCSTDETPHVIREARERFAINHRRLSENIGGFKNIVTIATEVATGKYCWVLGDDDLIRPGAIATVMKVLKANSDLGAIFVNHTEEQHAERERGDHLAAKEVYQSARLLCHDTSERRVDRWEDIVLLSNVPGIFTAISDHIFLRDIWVRRAFPLARYEPGMELSYELVFPHVSMLADEMVGKPAYYLGFPYVMLFVGHQEWGGLWAKYLFTFVLRIADQLERGGAGPEVVRHYRNMIFKNCVYAFRRLLFDQRRALASGGEWTKWRFKPEDDWSFRRLWRRFNSYQEFRQMVRLAFLQEGLNRAVQ